VLVLACDRGGGVFFVGVSHRSSQIYSNGPVFNKLLVEGDAKMTLFTGSQVRDAMLGVLCPRAGGGAETGSELPTILVVVAAAAG
jgi:hypothetical protein